MDEGFDLAVDICDELFYSLLFRGGSQAIIDRAGDAINQILVGHWSIADCRFPIANFFKSAIGSWQSAITLSVGESLEHLTGVILGLYLLENLFDLAFLIDQEGGSMDAHICSSHELLLSPNPISLRDRSIRVGSRAIEVLIALV